MELFATTDDMYVGLGVFSTLIQIDGELDLPWSKVDEMKRNLHSPSQRREAYIDLYATGHPCPNLRQVAGALHSAGLHHQAATVESTYVQGTRIIPMHPLSVTVIVRFVMAKHNTETFPVTLLIIVCANLKAGTDAVCLGVGVYLCTFHIIVFRARFGIVPQFLLPHIILIGSVSLYIPYYCIQGQIWHSSSISIASHNSQSQG